MSETPNIEQETTTTFGGPVVVAVALNGEHVGSGWGRAPQVAVSTIDGATIRSWEVHDVRWDVAHDEGGEGAHHARVVRFLRDNGVQVVVTGDFHCALMITIAAQMKGLVLAVEHRFYGESNPTPDYTTASLHYLSSRQVRLRWHALVPACTYLS